MQSYVHQNRKSPRIGRLKKYVVARKIFNNLSPTFLAKTYKISRSSVYRIKKVVDSMDKTQRILFDLKSYVVARRIKEGSVVKDNLKEFSVTPEKYNLVVSALNVMNESQLRTLGIIE